MPIAPTKERDAGEKFLIVSKELRVRSQALNIYRTFPTHAQVSFCYKFQSEIMLKILFKYLQLFSLYDVCIIIYQHAN